MTLSTVVTNSLPAILQDIIYINKYMSKYVGTFFFDNWNSCVKVNSEFQIFFSFESVKSRSVRPLVIVTGFEVYEDLFIQLISFVGIQGRILEAHSNLNWTGRKGLDEKNTTTTIFF